MNSVLPLIVGILLACCFWMGLALWSLDGRCRDLERRLDKDLAQQKYDNERQLAEFAEQIAADHKKCTCNDTSPKV